MSAAAYYNDGSSPPRPTVTTDMYSMQPIPHEYNHSYPPDEGRPQSPVGHAPSEAPPEIAKPTSQFNRLRSRKFEKLKRWLRIVRIVSKVVTTAFSTIMFVFMVYISAKYQSTKGTIRDDRNPWPKHPKLWPTIMLLLGSFVTLVMSIGILISYCCCFKRTSRSWKVTLLKYAVHIIAWIVISVLYRYEKSLHGDNNDLWGWSCSQEATAIQTEFHGVVNFNSLCTVQVSRGFFSPSSLFACFCHPSLLEIHDLIDEYSRTHGAFRLRSLC